jgi:cytochrome c oxidase assembly protein Cox11
MQRPVQPPFGMSARVAGPNRRRRNVIAVASSLLVIAIMGALTYYSVPLYRLFCQVTGFGGTTQVARTAPGAVAGPPITVRFDANVASNLPWRFSAPEPVEVHLGEQHQVVYTAVNLGSEPILGMAIYNVTPPTIGKYFYKIQCFCFTEQDMDDPTIRAAIDKNLALARVLRIDGTPGFVIGGQILRGATDLQTLQGWIRDARARRQ